MGRLLQLTHHETPLAGVGEFLRVTERFTAILDTPVGAINTLVRELPDLQFGQPHPEYRDTFVSEFLPRVRTNAYAVYDIDVEYEQPQPRSGQSSGQSPSSNPWEFEPIFEHGSIIKREIPTEDAEGNAMVNKAGEKIDAEFEIHYPTVTVTRNRLRRTRLPRGFRGGLNSDTVRIDGDIYTKEQVRVVSHTTRSKPPARFDQQPFVEEITTVSINFDGWPREFANAGYYEIVYDRTGEAVAEPERIRDANGEPLTIPQWLDERGSRPRDDKGDLVLPVPESQRVFLTRYPGKRIPLRRFFA